MRRKTRVSQVITHSDIASAFYTAWKWMLYVPSSLLQLAYLVWADFIQIASFDFRQSIALSLKGLTQLSQHLDYTGLHMHVRDVECARNNYAVLWSNFGWLYKGVAQQVSHNVIVVDMNLQHFPMWRNDRLCRWTRVSGQKPSSSSVGHELHILELLHNSAHKHVMGNLIAELLQIANGRSNRGDTLRDHSVLL